MRLRLLLWITAGSHCLITPYALTAQDTTRAPAFDSIREVDLRTDVAFLSADGMQGRRADTDGNRLASEFIASRFARLGLTPVADGDYLMPFSLIVPTLGPDDGNALGASDGLDEVADTFTLGRDFFPQRFSPTATAEGAVVFAGFGIAATELGYDDYGTSDVTGKVVLILNHEPGEYDVDSPFDGTETSEHARSVRKALEAERRGAVAVLFVTDAHNHDAAATLAASMDGVWPAGPRRDPRYELGAWAERLTIPAVRISTMVAERLVGGSGTTLSTLGTSADSGAFAPVELDAVVSVATSVSRERVVLDNVVGLIEGDDPTRRNEWLVVGAHFDHEGANGSRVYNGADDNASGVAGMLEMADAFVAAARAGHGPKRSILFAAWNAEERGLLGAWAYTEQPLAPLSDTVAMINLDMIGRDEEVPARGGRRFRGLPPQTAVSNRNAVNILGYSYSDDLRQATMSANVVGLTVRFRYDRNRSNLVRRSDHWPFLAHGVPALFVHTGLHPDYHTERDSADKLNYEKMTRVVQLVYQLSWDLANGERRPAMTAPRRLAPSSPDP